MVKFGQGRPARAANQAAALLSETETALQRASSMAVGRLGTVLPSVRSIIIDARIERNGPVIYTAA